MSDYDGCEVKVWDAQFYLENADGDEVLNPDGTTKLFDDPKDKVCIDTECVDPDDLRPVTPSNPAPIPEFTIKISSRKSERFLLQELIASNLRDAMSILAEEIEETARRNQSDSSCDTVAIGHAASSLRYAASRLGR
jgi:hypothetical protein